MESNATSPRKTIYISSNYVIGNTGIQLCVATLLKEAFKYDNLSPIPHQVSSIEGIGISEENWACIYPFLDRPPSPFVQRFLSEEILLSGYFQTSEPLVANRERLRSLLSTDPNISSFPVTKNGTTMAEVLAATPPPSLELRETDLVVHIRLGDYAVAKWIQDPAPTLAIVRAAVRAEPMTRVILVGQRPTTEAETNYFRLFEEFRPILHHGTELEDFAILRAAKRIVVANSTFSWFAAFLGDATERWIPEPTFNELWQISPSDRLYRGSIGFDLSRLALPTSESVLPVSGEFLMSLCDYVVTCQEIQDRFGRWTDLVIPKERQLLAEAEDTWPAEIGSSARILFAYPEFASCSTVFRRQWPALRLLVIHNGDNSVKHEAFRDFLERHPNVHILATNNLEVHPRVRTCPLLFENRMWRNGRRGIEGPAKDVDTPIPWDRRPPSKREIHLSIPHYGDSHPLRPLWRVYISTHCRSIPNLYVHPILSLDEYMEMIQNSCAVLCPPGNGADTHRHWETMFYGAWAIVQANDHSHRLLEDYPSLPLLPIQDIAEIKTLQIPTDAPSPFHPVFLRDYWRILLQSYVEFPSTQL